MPIIDPTTPPGVQPVGFSSGFTLKFSDEFNSSTPDPKWRQFINFGNGGSPSGRWDLNVNNNSNLRMWYNGASGHKDNYDCTWGTDSGSPYRTRYGYFEARIRVPRGKGFFPAFWVFDLGTQRELDFMECFSYDNGDTWTNGPPDWRPTDYILTQWNQGGSVQSRPGDNEATRRLRYEPPRGSQSSRGGGYIELDREYHVYACYWTPSVIRTYFDGVQVGNDMTPTPNLGGGNSNTFAIYLDGWWGPTAGNPTPNSSETPVGAGSESTIWFDYVRVWDIGSSTPPGPPPPPPPPPFSANLLTAPNDGATIAGNVFFRVEGNGIQNCELLPPTGYSPKYGTFSLFTLEDGLIRADFNWDTTALANGQIQVRISAFSTPPGQSGSELIPMATRTYTINNLTPVPPPPPPPPGPPPPGPPPPPAFDPDMQFCYTDLS